MEPHVKEVPARRNEEDADVPVCGQDRVFDGEGVGRLGAAVGCAGANGTGHGRIEKELPG